jgi:hypothetical protein
MDFKSVGKRSDDAATDYGHARIATGTLGARCRLS